MSTGYEAPGYGPAGNGMRVGNAEREATASELREHYASGRLTLEELNERLEATFAAKTGADLTAVMRDLPSAAASGTPGAGAGTPWPGQPWGGNFGGGSRGGGAGGAGSGSRSRAFAAFVPAIIGICMLAFFGLLALGGGVFGGVRPFGIGLLIAALALLKRLIFGRRGGPGGRRSRRR